MPGGRCQRHRHTNVFSWALDTSLHPLNPLVHFINLKIQTNNSTVAPVEVLSSAIEDLANETDHLITQFTDSVRK